MIDACCECGQALSFPESEAGKAVTCSACGQAMLLACGEELPPGAGAGDFDARIQIRSSLPTPCKTLFLGGVADISIGKAVAANIQLSGKFVSRAHCKLVRVDFGPSRWKVVDTGSSNGIFVNGERITEKELQPGDTVDVGEFELSYAMANAPTVLPNIPQPKGPTCPSCKKQLDNNAKFCVECGIDVKTGRSIAVSREFDENDFAVRADTWIRLVSWLVPLGLFPVASEAMGGRKPILTWVLVGLTILTSVGFFVGLAAKEEPDAQTLNLMMWTGSPGENKAETSEFAEELMREIQDENASLPADERISEEDLRELEEAFAEAGPVYPPGVGFRWYQPITAAFLHGGIMHLAGNLLFLIVFGARVNELVGNVKFAILYLALAYASGMAHFVASADGPAHPMLGASGAIMGLAGMYFVFYPVQKVHTAIWLRLRFWCAYKVFAMRGFWLLLLWIAFNDVLMMVLTDSDGVAHWAHVGGFVSGMVLALGLMIARAANAGGTDILSLVLGKRAWGLIGTPTQRMHKADPVALPAGVPRAVSMSYPE